VLGALALALTLAVAPSQAKPQSTSARPHALKMLINGKRWPLEALTTDKYRPIKAGTLRVEARWLTNARGTGYHVAILLGDTLSRTLVRCKSGTSCVVPGGVKLPVGQEMTLQVKILKTSSNRVVTGYKACLAAHA
jgi:hypothetical protein